MRPKSNVIVDLPRFTRHLMLALCVVACAVSSTAASDFVDVTRNAQSKIAKIYGAGGLRGMEAYQSGILISPDGHVLTVWSYVLDAGEVTVVLDDGRRATAELAGADPLTEIAVLKFDVGDDPVPHFSVADAATADAGSHVLALSNLFGIATGNEPVSVVHGTVSAVAPLAARRGSFSTRFQGEVYVVDAATNNPGAAGGALVDVQGRLLGMLGKEVRSELTNTWLNFALPVGAYQTVVEDILAGRYLAAPLDDLTRPDEPLSLDQLGIVTVSDVVTRTPPFIDRVVFESVADRAGLRADDLIVMVDGHVVNSCRELTDYVARYEQDAEVVLTVLRGDELGEFTLKFDEAVE
jgi:serine protease Do